MDRREQRPTGPGVEAPLPQRVPPMQPVTGSLPSDEDAFAFEVGWDGVRAIVICDRGRLLIHDVALREVTAEYPELEGLARLLRRRQVVLDGEIIVLDPRGRPSRERLQRRVGFVPSAPPLSPAVYMAFDVLHLDGRSLMALPYVERRRILDRLKLEDPHWHAPPSRDGPGAAMLEAARRLKATGIVAKEKNAPYEPGQRRDSWRWIPI
jgi:bifunctional non-homologous end joining protein LigD